MTSAGIGAVVFAVAFPATAAAPRRIAFVDVTVIDVDRSREAHPLSPHQTVVVTDGVISARGPSSAITVPEGADVVDGRRKFLLPGLWDMHVHVLPSAVRPASVDVWLPLFIANGVTGVRDMGGADAALRATRERIAREHLVAPRIVAAGSAIDGSPPQFGVGVNDAAEARREVLAHRASGADFIKPYNLLTREEFMAIAEEAARLHMPVAGHVPLSMTVTEVSDAGQRSVEHLTDIPTSCASIEEKLRADRRASQESGAVTDFRAWLRSRWKEEELAAQNHSPARCEALFQRLTRQGTWVVPTLVNKKSALDVAKRLADPRFGFVEEVTRNAWRKNASLGPATPREAESRAHRFAFMMQLVREADRASALLLTGTDVGSPFPLLPGFSLHEELEIFVEAGVTPLHALRAATIGPAEYLDESGKMGKVEAGYVADLLLLTRDPLKDIRNTEAIDCVVASGRLFTRPQLDALFEHVRAAANGR